MQCLHYGVPLLSICSNPFSSYRLKQELEGLAADKCQKYHTSLSALCFKFHTPPAKPNCTAWLGGNIQTDYREGQYLS